MAESLSVSSDAKVETTIPVTLARRSYEIIIGENLLAHAALRLDDLLPAARYAVVSDENVAPLHLADMKRNLQEQGLFLGEVIVPPGESSKCFSQLEKVCEQLLDLGVERGDCIIALGGGVVGDLAGFAASILRRGVNLVQMPTSLLAQVDSSVGGKTGIDTPQGKNLIGTFHQPALVLADLDVLGTLPERQLLAGYAEIAKYGLINDPEFFDWLGDNWRAVLNGEPEARLHAVATSCKSKAAIVEEDEKEVSGARALLNLGHTFGHALEAYTGYSDRLLHGEAIAIGMVLAFRYSAEQEICASEDAGRVERHFDLVGLPTAIKHIEGGGPSAAEMLRLMSQDKKVQAGQLALVLARGIGSAYLERDVDMDELTDFLKRECGSQ
ncbi:3-dehydroquinate synthase [Methyloligella solikamskensis]|uniref:3-dehydroquinate synthase n=1 Tax=Methyloligella solikamskensis TaxID=1177756 RepID=A0ABW3J7S2_9HYPH